MRRRFNPVRILLILLAIFFVGFMVVSSCKRTPSRPTYSPPVSSGSVNSGSGCTEAQVSSLSAFYKDKTHKKHNVLNEILKLICKFN